MDDTRGMFCPTCGATFADGARSCPTDGARLVDLSRTDPLLGRVFEERFTLQARLGEGAMGVVYRARQHSVGRDVAIKVIHTRHLHKTTSIKRFLREARIASQLSHPHTVSVLDFGHTPEGLLYLVMELISGQTLRAALEAEGPFPPARAVRIGAQVCDALEALHRHHIVHRDLKPANIMLLDGSPGRDLVKVLDFGLARPIDVEGDGHITQTGVVAGTPLYMAPEIVRHEVPRPESDLYALGVVLYELLNGHPPFTHETQQAVMAAHVSEAPPPSTGSVPRRLEAVIRRALEKAPEDRYRTAAALRTALTDSLAPTAAADTQPSGVLTPPVVSAPRRWPRFLVAGGVVVALGVGAWWALQDGEGERGQRQEPVLVNQGPDGGTEAEADADNEPENEADAETETESESETETETESERETETESESESESETETETERESERETETETESGAETETETERTKPVVRTPRRPPSRPPTAAKTPDVVTPDPEPKGDEEPEGFILTEPGRRDGP